ncbi:MAG: hypothetical protein A4E66_00020 [Syntrophus sp. PtaB.Bin001]|nr:MAG: hypothetical protein A4E66_00020 [Syntrophus sp. PtaB.Bin001]
MIRITSKQEGFRRCGMAHPATATEYPSDKFSKKELEILKGEPTLIVEEIADEPAKKETKKGAAKQEESGDQDQDSK